MQIKGIDVSKYQGNIDFESVKKDGIGFVIIRAGYGREVSQKDTCFESNYANAKAACLPVGAYWYSYAESVEDAIKEANACLEVISGKQFEYPIYFDLEEQAQFAKGKEHCSTLVKAFCDTLEKAGYFAGLYISRSPLQTHITEEVAKRYSLWVAEYASKCNYDGAYDMWQHSSKGSVDGIQGNVDLDWCYKDFPTIIKNGGFNGFSAASKSESSTVKTFTFTDKTQLTQHFNVSEFRCKCGDGHNTLLDVALVDMLERLFSALNCSKIIVNSGYRCSTHDKNAGGNGAGQHTKGKAADIVCYDQSGAKISSKIVTCAAQDLRFTGIARVNDTATHLDNRIGSKWYGDETISSSKNITTDFYAYWNLTKEDVYGKADTATPDSGTTDTPVTGTDTDNSGESKDVTLTIDGKTYTGSLKEK